MERRSQGDSTRVLALQSAGAGKLLFKDGSEAAPDITYAIEIYGRLTERGPEKGIRDFEGSGRLTLRDPNLRNYREREFVLETKDADRVAILVTWSDGLTHGFESVGEPTKSASR